MHKKYTARICKWFPLFFTLSLFFLFIIVGFVLDNKAYASLEKRENIIPASTNFLAEGDVVPFTFWQKTISVNGQPMDETYSYVFERLTPDSPMPEGSSGDKFIFSLTDDNIITFNINYSYSGNFIYKATMLQPEQKPNYSYDATTYSVVVNVDYGPKAKERIHVYCYNPIGEKVYDPGWTITYNEPLPEKPPQTFDFSFVILIAVIVVLLLSLLLVVIDRRIKIHKNRMFKF